MDEIIAGMPFVLPEDAATSPWLDVTPKGLQCVTVVAREGLCGAQATHFDWQGNPFCDIHNYHDESYEDYEGEVSE